MKDLEKKETELEKAEKLISDAKAEKFKQATDVINEAVKKINELGFSLIIVGGFRGAQFESKIELIATT